MNEDFEDQLRLAIRDDEIDIPADTAAAIEDGRRIVRGRRVGWGVAACSVVAAAALLLPGVIQLGVPAVPAEPGATVSASPASGRALAGTDWNAVKLEGAALRPGTSITLSFRDGWVEGFGGCNTFGYSTTNGEIAAGAYHQDGDRLTIAPVATTEKGCPNGVSDQEGRFLQALPRVERFSITGQGLALFEANGSMLLQFASAAPELERSGWTVTSVRGALLATPDPPFSLVFLGGEVSVFDGCSSFGGTYSADGERLHITFGGRPTSVYCDFRAVGNEENDFRGAVIRAARAVVQGDRLTLWDAAGVQLLDAINDPAVMLAAEGATWRLDNVDGRWGNGKDSQITLQVGDLLEGKTGCGDYDAPYTHRGTDWTITRPTLRNPLPCPNTTSAGSVRFLGLLPEVTAVQVTENQLRLVTPDETLSFSRK